MEQLVEQYAAMLMSDEHAKLYETIRGLEELKAQGAQNIVARVKYSRLLQELLAYKGGALVKSILQKAVDVTASTDIFSRESHSRCGRLPEAGGSKRQSNDCKILLARSGGYALACCSTHGRA